jgi:hypothetical protein
MFKTIALCILLAGCSSAPIVEIRERLKFIEVPVEVEVEVGMEYYCEKDNIIWIHPGDVEVLDDRTADIIIAHNQEYEKECT